MADDKRRAPADQYKDIEAAPLPPIAPDGGLMPGPVGMPVALPPATPANFACLRGPCRHYWELTTFVAAGNPAGTFGPDGLKDEHGRPLPVPKQINRSCLVHPGTETELTEDNVFDCNRWEPMSPRDLRRRLKERESYYRKNPTHRPTEER